MNEPEHPIGEMVYLAMVKTAENLGHALGYIEARDAYPGSVQELNDVMQDLEDRRWIKRTSKGHILLPLCKEHEDVKTTD